MFKSSKTGLLRQWLCHGGAGALCEAMSDTRLRVNAFLCKDRCEAQSLCIIRLLRPVHTLTNDQYKVAKPTVCILSECIVFVAIEGSGALDF